VTKSQSRMVMTEMDESAAPCAYTDHGRGTCPAPAVARRTPRVLAPRQVARRALLFVHHPKVRRKKGDESAAGCRACIPTRRHAEHYRVHAPFIPWHAGHRRGCLRLIKEKKRDESGAGCRACYSRHGGTPSTTECLRLLCRGTPSTEESACASSHGTPSTTECLCLI